MEYTLGPLIGKGSDGEVYELLDKENISKKVIKFIQPSIFGIRNYLEPYILLHFRHEHIMSADKIEIEDDGLVKIIQDKASADMNKKLREKNISVYRKLKYMRELTEAVYYLQTKRIIHGDIKPHNILLFNDHVKLADFSLARIIMKEPTICTQKPYTISYRPPEARDNQLFLKSDIWALACTLYEIYYDSRYFNISKQFKIYHLSEKLENNLFDKLIISMLELNIEKRASIEEIINFFNIEEIKHKTYLKPKLNFQDNHIQSKFLQKCYFDEKNNKMSKKYMKTEQRIAEEFNFDLFENIHEISY